MVKLALSTMSALVIMSWPVWGADFGCSKENVVQGGLDRSLPCVFRSPLQWADHRVMFTRNSSVLDSQAKAVLDKQAEILRGHPALPFTVWGHVDHKEATGKNGKALGFQRANAVRDYLIAHGIAPERITTNSRGDKAMVIASRAEDALAVMRYATTETEDNPRPSK